MMQVFLYSGIPFSSGWIGYGTDSVELIGVVFMLLIYFGGIFN